MAPGFAQTILVTQKQILHFLPILPFNYLEKNNFLRSPAILYLTFTAYSEFIPFRALLYAPIISDFQPASRDAQEIPNSAVHVFQTINGGYLITYGWKPRATTIYMSVNPGTYSSSFSIEKRTQFECEKPSADRTMATIKLVKARQIFDSRGNPTVEVSFPFILPV